MLLARFVGIGQLYSRSAGGFAGTLEASKSGQVDAAKNRTYHVAAEEACPEHPLSA
jgi:hypothetical protein